MLLVNYTYILAVMSLLCFQRIYDFNNLKEIFVNVLLTGTEASL